MEASWSGQPGGGRSDYRGRAGSPAWIGWLTRFSPLPARAQCTLRGLDEPARMPGVAFEELSRRAAEADRTEEAVRFHRAGVDLNPLWHDGGWRLGILLSDAGCFDAARDALRRVVQRGLHAQALLLIRRGDFTTPAKNLGILVRIEPDDPELVTA